MNQHVKVLVASFNIPHLHFIVCTEKTNENLQQDSWSLGKNSNLRIYRAWKNSMTKLPEVMGRTKTKIYCPATICQMRILAVPVTIKVGLTKVGNQAKPVTYSEKKLLFLPILSRCSATDLDSKLTTMQQRLSCALKCQAAAASTIWAKNPLQYQFAMSKSSFSCGILAGIFNSHF